VFLFAFTNHCPPLLERAAWILSSSTSAEVMDRVQRQLTAEQRSLLQ
jgi:hypothetical protein